MFTGIIEELGVITHLEREKENLHITVQSSLTEELKIDQSVAHNGVCLTVVDRNLDEKTYVVTAIQETLEKTNVGAWQVNDRINLERAMKLGDRLDGHIVQGHVDQIGTCISIKESSGSWYYTFEYDAALANITIEKGSVTINGTSLTVVNSEINTFSVAIIPYTYSNTIFQYLKVGSLINLEFDVIGKYVARLQGLSK
jgi:riboflavin synthase